MKNISLPVHGPQLPQIKRQHKEKNLQSKTTDSPDEEGSLKTNWECCNLTSNKFECEYQNLHH